jgi:aminoglycoside phosphotransferase (APT) family kinase protein
MFIMEEDVAAEVRSALASHGLRGWTVETLSARSFGRKSGRFTLRVEAADGSVIKARCFESVEAASRLAELRSRVDAAFVPVIARYGAVLLEPWIDGEALSAAQAEARAEEVGAVLGRLHATELAAEHPRVSTRERRERAIGRLAELAESGVVTTELVGALGAELRQCDPGESPRTVVHRDYCPENIVVDPGGRLHVVDNEWLDVDAPGVDLGRTYSRWPMPDDVWKRFLRGYQTTAPFPPGPLRFWMILMAAAGATVRLRKPAAELAVPLARLHELAGSVSQR